MKLSNTIELSSTALCVPATTMADSPDANPHEVAGASSRNFPPPRGSALPRPRTLSYHASRALSGFSSSSRASSAPLEETRGQLGLNLLSAPNDPVVDFVFVHGLEGGSRKTWSKGSDPARFWPKEWLPRDPEFKDIRIHSFGYDSAWSSRQRSILDIRDFGRALLTALQGSPFIRRNESVKPPASLTRYQSH